MDTLRTLLVFSTPAFLFSVTPVYAQSLGGPGNPGKTIDTLSSPASSPASPIALAAAGFSVPRTPSDAVRPIFRSFRPPLAPSATAAGFRAFNVPAAAEPLVELPSLPLTSAQSGDGYDEWRARMDAARAKRRRGMILTAGGLLGAPLIASTVFAASSASVDTYTGVERAAGAAWAVYLAGIGTGVWGVFEWINGHSEVGELELDGRREGYVSITPVPGGVAGSLAFSF